MARPRKHFDESIASDIFYELHQFAARENTIPGMHAFWRYMTNAADHPFAPGLGYSITWPAFRYHWTQMLIEQRVRTERVTGAVKIQGIKVISENSD